MASTSLVRLSLSPAPKTLIKHHPQTLIKRHPKTTITAAAIPITSILRHPLQSTFITNLPFIPKLHPKITPKTTPPTLIRNSYSPTPAVERLISAVAYCLPFFNGLQYGRHLFIQYPILGNLFEPILPFLGLYRSVPYASFIAFFAIYLGVVRNPSFSRYVRFNAMQAVVLDVLLALPMLLQRIFNPGRAGFGYRVMVMGHNAVFVFVVFCFVYSLVSSLLGKTPYLPFVADAAGRQL